MSEQISDEEVQLLERIKKECIPHLSIDCVIFGYDRKKLRLKVLLIKMKRQEKWGLPGGFIKFNENLNDAGTRILKERTGAERIFLKQFKAFGDLNRSEDFFQEGKTSVGYEWLGVRFISIGFYALVDYNKVNIKVDALSSDCRWIDIEELPPMMMDHRQIFDKALSGLRKSLTNSPVGYSLLPKKFTMPELQKLYEIILGKTLNRGNFYRKILKYQILNKLDEIRSGGAHKAPYLYMFDKEKYDEAVRGGLKDVW